MEVQLVKGGGWWRGSGWARGVGKNQKCGGG